MEKTLIIDGMCRDEVRIAMIDKDQRLNGFVYENTTNKSLKNNIYLGTITRIEPALHAVFIDYGALKNGFLSFYNIDFDIINLLNPSSLKTNKKKISFKIGKHQIVCGQKILIQVTKNERGSKGVSLNSYISLVGRYMIFSTNLLNKYGVSRNIQNKQERLRLKAIAEEIFKKNSFFSFIIRTAAEGRAIEEIDGDYSYLLSIWNYIKKRSLSSSVPSLIYSDSDIIRSTLRDLRENEFFKIIVDGHKAYRAILDICKKMIPQIIDRITLHKKSLSAFSYYEIDEKLKTFCNNRVDLPSGGYLIINKTEAVVAIDINSGKMTNAKNLQDTAFLTNCEAVYEIALQIRVRNLSGLIVIDFIDMDNSEKCMYIEKLLTEETKKDRSKVQIGKISNFGILEMSRQRLDAGTISEYMLVDCPFCNGSGSSYSVAVIAMMLVKKLESNVVENKSCSYFIVTTSYNVMAFILNNSRYRSHISYLESSFNVKIVVNVGHIVNNEPFSIQIKSETEMMMC